MVIACTVLFLLQHSRILAIEWNTANTEWNTANTKWNTVNTEWNTANTEWNRTHMDQKTFFLSINKNAIVFFKTVQSKKLK